MPEDSRLTYGSLYRKLYIAVIAEMAVLMAAVLIWGLPQVDTYSYFAAYDNWRSGGFDYGRTPVYPFLIGVCRSLAGDIGGKVIVWGIQSAVFLYSLTRFRRIAAWMTDNPKVAFLMTAVYGLAPGPLSLHFFLLTESLSLSGVTILLYLLMMGMRGDLKAVIWSIPLTVGLLMLRPSFLYLPVALSVLWAVSAIAGRPKRPVIAAGMAGIVVAVLTITLYSGRVERDTGYRGLSSIALLNTYLSLKDAGLSAGVPAPIPECASYGEVYETYKETIATHKEQVVTYLVRKRMPDVCSSDAIYGGGAMVLPPLRLLTKYISVNNGTAYFLFLLYLIMLVRGDLRQRRISIYKWFLAAMFVGCNGVVILGAPGEWPRLLIPDIPVLLLISGLVFTRLCDIFSINTHTAKNK